MNKTRLGVALAAAVSAALACGQGHLIFNVDVFSFIASAGKDTITFPTIPATLGGSDSTPPLSVQLPPGLSKSVVDTVSVIGSMLLTDNTGSGTMHFEVFFAGDSAATYSGTPALYSDTVAVPNGGAGVTLTLNGNLTQALDSLFTLSKVWIGIRATTQAGVTSITNGKLRLTALNAHVVINDKFF